MPEIFTDLTLKQTEAENEVRVRLGRAIAALENLASIRSQNKLSVSRVNGVNREVKEQLKVMTEYYR